MQHTTRKGGDQQIYSCVARSE